MIVLPKGAFTVLPDEVKNTTQAGIILSNTDKRESDTGIIVYTSQELNKYQGLRIKFRPAFAEDIEIEGTKLKYFRDFDSSFYYILKDEQNKR